MTGQTISHYRILEKLGEGGMGVVYKAEDQNLHRPVALKFLRTDSIGDQHLHGRFWKEAEAAAALDHPNIPTIHEIGEVDGQTFIAMAFVEGEDLAAKIKQRPLPLDEALRIAIQVAEALQAAHQRGIVHRDIKPSNVMITPEGRVKVMDFGLAHLAGQTRITRTGTIMGTPAYMSPEQARGEEVDHRSDIWSLGVVLYETLTGQLPFRGETAQTVALSIQNETPEPLTALRTGIPRELDRVVAKAFVKDPQERYPHVEDLAVDLRALNRNTESGSAWVEPPKAARRETAESDRPPARRWRWLLGGAVAAVVALGGALWLNRAPAPNLPYRVMPLTTYPGVESQPSLSPDGRQVAFSWNGPERNNEDIYVKLIGSAGQLRLTSDPATESSPAWSPDGATIAFYRYLPEGRAAVVTVSALGGSETTLLEIRFAPAAHILSPYLAWSPDGEWLAIVERDSPEPFSLSLLSTRTRERRRLTNPPEDWAAWAGDSGPAFSPDGRTLAFVRTKSVGVDDIYLLTLSDDLNPSGEPRRMTALGAFTNSPTWTADGRELVFASRYRLWRVSSFAPGRPRSLPMIGAVSLFPTISSQGDRLVYSHHLRNVNIWRVDLAASGGPASEPVEFISSTYWDRNPQYSPDGKRIAFESFRTGGSEVWVCEADGSNPIQLTEFGGSLGGSPRWSPDGKHIAFDSRVEGQADIFYIDAGGGVPRRLTTDPSEDFQPNWSRDGRWVYFGSRRSGALEIWKVPAAAGEAVQVTHDGGFYAAESPGGDFLYYSKRSETGCSLWKVPLDSGLEREVLGAMGSCENFQITDDGVYFREASWIKRLHPHTEEVDEIAELSGSFSVSSDGRSLLFTRADPPDGDLMLVENFR